MENTNGKNIQTLIFEDIRRELPDRFELAKVVAKLLEVSTDSVYRRIRGEKELSINELIILCKYFNLSFDDYLEYNINQVLSHPLIRSNIDSEPIEYARRLIQFFQTIMNIQEKEFLLMLPTPQFSHFMYYKELMLFKAFEAECGKKQYTSFSAYMKDNTELIKYCKEATKFYDHMPVSEVWTESILRSTLQSLLRFNKLGVFNDKKMPQVICNQMLQFVERYEELSKHNGEEARIKVYLSKNFFETNFYVARFGPLRMAGIKVSSFNLITSSDTFFCESFETYIEQTIKDSISLSNCPQRERDNFFASLKQEIEATANQL